MGLKDQRGPFIAERRPDGEIVSFGTDHRSVIGKAAERARHTGRTYWVRDRRVPKGLPDSPNPDGRGRTMWLVFPPDGGQDRFHT